MNTPAPVPVSPHNPWRRRAGVMGLAAVAALAGVGVAWWKLRPREVLAGAEEGLWRLRFTRPDGGELVLAALRGKPLLINFWATWCPPCVEELPLLERFYRENRINGWQVVALAIDQPSAVRAFLGKMPLSFPVGLAGFEGTDLARSLGNPGGALPFTVVLDGRGLVTHRRMGQVTAQDLQAWASLS